MAETEEEKIARLTEEIKVRQLELRELSRYRYRTVPSKHQGPIRLRDDGYRIDFQLPEAVASSVDKSEWIMWAEYKQCDLPGIGNEIADLLMVA